MTKFEIGEWCEGVDCVDLGESFQMSIYYLLPKFGFDRAENEPCKFCPLSMYRSPRFRWILIATHVGPRISFGRQASGGTSLPRPRTKRTTPLRCARCTRSGLPCSVLFIQGGGLVSKYPSILKQADRPNFRGLVLGCIRSLI